MSDNPVMLYDGVCNLCNESVRFVLKRDKKHRFRFAALQSKAAQELLAAHNVTIQMDTIYLLMNGQLYDRSSAALRIMGRLSALWPLIAVFLIIPKPVRDWVYNKVGTNRYRLFGRTDECQIPDKSVRRYFLDLDQD
ncbi:thiol-disulfide oxidoreductase DCC family protein [Kordiimonas sp.]|uniref:thiol-disulfide oxidoreductase DCC family protein n=1 Tax=Kordiimonas sp. TaxID=1970157 RepID=UPI003A940543